MRKKKNRFGLLSIGLAVVLVGSFLVFSFVVGEQRKAAQATVQKPEAFDTYKALDQELQNAEAEEASATNNRPRTPKSNDKPSNLKERVTRFQALMTRAQKIEEERFWKALYSQGGPSTWTDQRWVSLKDHLRNYVGLLDEMRVLAAGSGPLYPLDLSKGYDVEPEHLPVVRQFARAFAHRALLLVRDGQVDEAIEDILTAAQCGDAVKQEPILASQFARATCHEYAVHAITNAFEPGILTSAQIDPLLDWAASAVDRDAFAAALYGERYVGNQFFDAPMAYESSDKVLSIDNSWERLFFQTYSGPLGQSLRDQDQITFVNTTQELMELARLPYYEAFDEKLRILIELKDSFLPRISRHLVADVAWALEDFARYETTIELMRVGLATENFQLRQTRYPLDLDELADAFDGEVPIDPFTGQAFRYAANEDRFTLYSLGRNRRDDRGEHHGYTKDLVWRAEKRIQALDRIVKRVAATAK
jgi:hypothetical protein